MAATEAEVRRDRAALIPRVQANDSAQRSLTWDDTDGRRVDGEHIRWTESELSSIFNALRTNTHVTALMLDKQSAPESDEMMQEFTSMLAANRSITTIHMWHCAVDGPLLARGLKQHPMLGSLALGYSEMPVGDMRAVVTALLDCPHAAYAGP
jgi:hypothetical protein